MPKRPQPRARKPRRTPPEHPETKARKRPNQAAGKGSQRGRGSPLAQAAQLEKYRAFAAAYARGMSAAVAARMAGYSNRAAGNRGWALLKRPDVQQLVQEEREKHLAEISITVRWLQEQYVAVYQEARETADLNGATKALDSLAKTIGAFSETVRHEHLHLHALADTELAQRIADLEAELRTLPPDPGTALALPAAGGTTAPDQAPQDPDPVPGHRTPQT